MKECRRTKENVKPLPKSAPETGEIPCAPGANVDIGAGVVSLGPLPVDDATEVLEPDVTLKLWFINGIEPPA